jgi:hypothetical protein
MNKIWLSQLLDDSAFPLLVLALAIGQINLGSYNRSNLLPKGKPSPELRLDDRVPKASGEYGLSNSNKSPASTIEWLQR